MGEHSRLDLASLLGAALGLVTGVWVGLGGFLQALLVLMVADIATGFIAAAKSGDLSSRMADLGLSRKVVTLILISALGYAAEAVGERVGFYLPAGQTLCGAYILREVVSLIENAHRAGVDIGPFQQILAAAKRTTDPPAPAKE